MYFTELVGFFSLLLNSMRKINMKIWLFGALLLLQSILKAQFYYNGQDPALWKWLQIKTEHFTVVCPENHVYNGKKISGYLEHSYYVVAKDYNVFPSHVTVILHPADVVSNAQVAWAPKRMEFNTIPPQDAYPQNWLEQLAIHEYRHVVQINALNKGFAKVLSYAFGEQAIAAILGAYVPFWFIEGDATLSETLYSHSGRGRIPLFSVPLKAQIIDKKIYTYDKAVFGSFRDFVPDHYVLGYNLVTVAQLNYGQNIWNYAMKSVAGNPYMITPFNHGIKKSSGMRKVKLYKFCMNQLDSIWGKELKNIEFTTSKPITYNEKAHTDYLNPCFLADNKIVTARKTIGGQYTIVSIDSAGNYRKLFVPGFGSEMTLSAAKNIIVWAECSFDPRWENRTWSVIKIYDVKKNKIRKLTHKTRYFSPSISPDAENIALASCDDLNNYSLTIINTLSGDVIKKFPIENNEMLITPSWSDDGRKITAVILNDKGKRIQMWDFTTGENKTVVQTSTIEISKPVMFDNMIYFSSAYTGIDNLFLCDTNGRNLKQLTSVRYGAINPCVSPDGNMLVWSEYTADGYMLRSVFLDSVHPVLFEPEENKIKYICDFLQECNAINFSDTVFNGEIKSYRKIPHLLNVHSWGPLSIDANSNSINPGLSVMSQNKLSTMIISAGYEYNVNEQNGKYYADVSFMQWYPVFDLRFETGLRKSAYMTQNNEVVNYQWKETALRTSVRVPLNFSSGKWLRWMQPYFSSTYYKIDPGINYHESFFSGYIRTLDYKFTFYDHMLSVEHDINPKRGISFSADYRHTPFDGYRMGQMYGAQGYIYVPGFAKHNSISGYIGWQKKNNADVKYVDIIQYPRGLEDKYDDRLFSLKANYTLPVLYPDFSLGSLVYIKRLRANVFYDYAEGGNPGVNNIYRTTGFEVMSDMFVLRFVAPVALGVRVTKVLNENKYIPELLYSVDFNSIR